MKKSKLLLDNKYLDALERADNAARGMGVPLGFWLSTEGKGRKGITLKYTKARGPLPKGTWRKLVFGKYGYRCSCGNSDRIERCEWLVCSACRNPCLLKMG